MSINNREINLELLRVDIIVLKALAHSEEATVKRWEVMMLSFLKECTYGNGLYRGIDCARNFLALYYMNFKF